MSIEQDLKKTTDKIEKLLKAAVKSSAIRPTAQEMIKIIVRRTRLGYGVNENGQERSRLLPLSPKYKKSRIRFKTDGILSTTTTPNKSNLTLTGQMLESVKIIKQKDGEIVIGPKGPRDDGLTNEQVAQYQVLQGRIFMNLSRLEFQQVLRFYRKTFTDLQRKLKLVGK